MKRPADQAKLLLFALLRSTATALATTGEKTRMVLPQAQNIQLRLATRIDVPFIQGCNLACLPENYNSQFYSSHLRQWPEYAIVAEDHGADEESSFNSSDQDRHFFNLHPTRGHSPPKIVAYVLGKVETRPVYDYSNPSSGEQRVESLGHVTSLAVQKDFRRLGLAKSLMTQLHHHLQTQGVQSCGLHVRTSNIAACRLYQDDDYEIAQIIPSYYQDGEDAYFMRKILPVPLNTASGSHTLFGKKIWKTGPDELRLPRQHRNPYSNRDDTSSESSSGSASPEVLSGIL